MGKRRLQVATTDDEADDLAAAAGDDCNPNKRAKPNDDGNGGDDGGEQEAEKDVVEEIEDAKPIGDVIKVSGKGRKKKKHYSSFEYDGNVFELEDPVLLTPEDNRQKPYVAIIKDITEDVDGSVMVTGQWFYRPEEAEKKGGGSWQTRDTRELFYSFHLDEVPAESVMHKCVVHFVPLHKQWPIRSQHPGFIVQKVYDTVEKKLWKLTDTDYEDNKQEEINVLIAKTMERVGDLPDVEEAPVDTDEHSKSKWNLRRKNLTPMEVRKDDTVTKADLTTKAETPGSRTPDVSEYNAILAKFKALIGDSTRDKWLEKLLQGIQSACDRKEDDVAPEDKKGVNATMYTQSAGDNSVPKHNHLKDGKEIVWPDSAVQAITALEKTTYETLGSEHHKYNQKMRQLDFNLKNNAILAKRLLTKELDPVVVFNMSPNELKDGFTAEEKAINEPEKPRQIQMTDACCSRCSERKVGVVEIIHAGGHGDRYQLECIACGNSWYAFRDEISSLTIDGPTVAKNVGTAPWATAKFEEVEKKLVSPRESAQVQVELIKKTTEPCVPVLDTQKSFNKSKNEELEETQKSFEQ